MLVSKKEGTLSFCVNYLNLNTLTILDSYSIPCIYECIDSLGDATIFSALDVSSEYCKVENAQDSHNKTAFTSHHGQFRVTQMPFGLRNASGSFQPAMGVLLAKFNWQYAMIYIDDIIILQLKAKEHINHVRQFLTLLHDTDVTLNQKREDFSSSPSTKLAMPFALAPRSITTRDLAINDLQHPTTVMALQSFHGLCNVFRCSEPSFAHGATPLNKRWHKGQLQTFDESTNEKVTALYMVKVRFLKRHVLALPRSQGTIQLTLTESKSRFNVSFYRTNQTVPADQFNTGCVRLMIPRAPTKKSTESV